MILYYLKQLNVVSNFMELILTLLYGLELLCRRFCITPNLYNSCICLYFADYGCWLVLRFIFKK